MATNDVDVHIYYVGKTFMILDEQHALTVRKHRIVGQLSGCCPTNPHQIIKFKILRPKINLDKDINEQLFTKKLKQFTRDSIKESIDRRINELVKRGIDPTPQKVGKFDENKVRWVLPYMTIDESSIYQVEDLEYSSFSKLIDLNDHMNVIFFDLYERGFYVGSGMKFGSDFLLYPGDPVGYHAMYAVRYTKGDSRGFDFSVMNFQELNAFSRLAYTANKIPIIATVENNKIYYWTLKLKKYLNCNSNCDDLEVIEPRVQDYRKSARITNDDNPSINKHAKH